MALMKDDLWRLVCGEENVPTDNGQLARYTTRKHKALAVIVLSIDPSLLYIVGEADDPILVWEKLQNQFEKKSWSNKLYLRRKLHTIRLVDGGSVQDHIKQMMDIFDELARIGDPLNEEYKVIYLLASLPESYNILVTALEASIEVPKMEIVTEKLLHEEMKKSGENQDENSAFYSRNNRNANFKNKGKNEPVCFHCGRPGHIRKNCYSYKNAQKEKVMNVDVENSDSDCGLMISHCLSANLDENWVIDSGATAHMCFSKNKFTDYKVLSSPINVCVGDGRTLEAVGKGNIDLIFIMPSGDKVSKLNNVLHVPKLHQNLLSVSMAAEKGKIAIFNYNSCKFVKNNKCYAMATKIGNLYYLNCKTVENAYSGVSLNHDILWHKRLGHVSKYALNKLVESKILNIKVNFDSNECVPCSNGKNKRSPFKTRTSISASYPLEIIHSDVCTVGENSLSNCKYFLTFIDDYSRFVWVYFLKNKSDVFQNFIEWKAMAENQLGRNVKILRTDSGGEYLSNVFKQFTNINGILHQTTIPKTPEQNGVSERMNRTLVEMTRTMLNESQLPKKFWAEALSTSAYIRNRVPTKSLNGKTPFEILFGKKPDIYNFKIFGCEAYAHIPKDERRKLDSKSLKCVFLGYGNNIKGYRLFDLNRERIIFSRDVIFNEMKFNFESKNNELEKFIKVGNESDNELSNESDNELGNQPIVPSVLPPNNDTVVKSRPKRLIQAPDKYGEWVSVALADSLAPSSVDEALASADSDLWKIALNNEIDSLMKNNVWNLEELPLNKKAIGCKFIFKKKIDGDGKISSFKCRLVAQGFSQKKGVDYEETFCPVVRFETIRALIAFSASNNAILHHMDVCCAFLNGNLSEEIYMRQPEGFVVKGKEHMYCKLNKSIYGLKQAPKCWNESIHNYLLSLKFRVSVCDSCLYINNDDGTKFYIAVYVDDLFLCCQNLDKMNRVKKLLSDRYEMKDLNELKYFLGVEVKYTYDSIWLGQSIYSEIILEKFGMSNCKAVKTPFDCNNSSLSCDSNPFDKKLFKQAIGSLLFLSVRTRPDLCFSVNRAAQSCENPTEYDWMCVKRIFRYIKGSINIGIKFYKNSNLICKGYSDADWAGECKSRKSTSGYIFSFCGGPISWQSRKQSSVSLSTAEAEFISLAGAVQEALWLNNLMIYFNDEHPPIEINVDNQSAISIAKNDQFHKRTKHIDIKFKFVKDSVDKNLIVLKFCGTETMIADFLTKGLTYERLNMLRRLIGVQS